MLIADKLTRSFGARLAVDGVSFELAPGEIFALVGPNGAGKTTTLRMLAGLISPSSGAVRLAGKAMHTSSSALRAGIGFLTEAPGLWDRLTVRQNLRVYAALHGLRDRDGAVEKALDLFGITARGNDAAAVLSKGLRQRVALARTLLHDPPVVLLDEPTSGLDPESARDVRELILHLQSERRAVLISTHNLDEVDRLAARVALLNTHIVALDTPAALRARAFGTRVRITLSGPVDPYAALLRAGGVADVRLDGQVLSVAVTDATTSTTSATPDLVKRLVDAGARIEAVEQEQPSLEEVYLRLMSTRGQA
jgi:ABC-2 type transport system ATP-binding protein